MPRTRAQKIKILTDACTIAEELKDTVEEKITAIDYASREILTATGRSTIEYPDEYYELEDFFNEIESALDTFTLVIAHVRGDK